jgi:putative flippase GtrA
MRHIRSRVPAPVASWLRTRFGKHLSRFAGVAVLSVITTQVVLSVAYLIIGTGGAATLIGWVAGAAVSYLLSRKAWDRKGRPDLLKETLPFWIIACGTAIVLTTAGHLAGGFAKDHHLTRIDATAVVAATVLVANVLTFVARFIIFHYVVFAEPRRLRAKHAAPARPVRQESLSPVVVPAPGERLDL